MAVAPVLVRRIFYSAFVLGAAAWALSRYWPGSKAETAEVQDEASTHSRAPAAVEPAVVGTSRDIPRLAGATDAAADGRSLLDQARELLVDDPARAERLARKYAERYPNSSDMDECDALLVYATWNGSGVDRARAEASRYFRRHPRGEYTEQLSRLTGMHPRFSPLDPPRSSGP